MIIAGHGFVGKAHELLFNNHFDIEIYDPPKGLYANFETADAVVICVPTPESSSGACDMSAVYDVVERVPENVPVLIKSTISLQGWDYLKQTFPDHELCFSPEFLRAANYMNDIKNFDSVILSGSTLFWSHLFERMDPKLKQYVVTPYEAITIKYFRNAFLATKVSFFNEIYDFCKAYNIDFDQVRAGVGADSRIGESHTYVDPEDGLRGWGGYCFPKDTAALLKMAAEKNINLNTLDAAVEYNKNIRKNP